MRNRQYGFTLIETVISMFISLILSSTLCFLFISLYKNITKIKYEVSDIKERLVKDKYIRKWAEQIDIPYCCNPDKDLTYQTDTLLNHPYFKNSIDKIDFLIDDMFYKRGISVTYVLSNNEKQTTIAQFKSYSLVQNEK